MTPDERKRRAERRENIRYFAMVGGVLGMLAGVHMTDMWTIIGFGLVTLLAAALP